MRETSKVESLSILKNPSAIWNRAPRLVGWHLRALPLSNELVVLSSCLSQPAPLMGTDLAAILISSVFLGVGYVIAKFFPEASLMAAVFLVGLAILNITLALLA